ncbi:TetR/AcrR family transcriptional regulator [Desulfatibacillum aliphaticivorans]|uniref:TetR/AcrR family transcriptional regulator n=1 Tax=Desulfatibacillum aliphaticivorans TaxID=218208 RepID=UPI0004250485|nr:TetR/AcrR family transcriptional regulator [Desulfatibacillum aliphaticivorans]
MKISIPGKNKKCSKDRWRGEGSKGAATRKMIIAAGRRVFRSHPYHTASFRMIAQEGGFSFTLINHYFTKAELFESVVEEVMEELLAASKTWMEGLDAMPAEKGLSLFLDRVLAYLFDNPDPVLLLMQNVAEGDKDGEIPGFDRFSAYVSEAKDMIIQVAPGEYDSDRAVWWVYSMINLMIVYIGASSYHAKVLGVAPRSPEYKNWIKQSLMYLFLPRLERSVKSKK